MSIRSLHLAAVIAAACVLSACGGGGGSDGPPAVGSIALSGTAARGAALAGATVSVKCVAGTPTAVTATTSGTGAYSITLDGATLPCVLRVSDVGGEVFHSVAAGTGSSGSVTANLSPLTEMVVAQLAGAAPGSFFDAFGAGASVSAADLANAVAYVKTALGAAADLGTINPVGDALAVGDAHDQTIEAAVAALAAAGATLQSVTTAIAGNPAAPTVIGSALAPAASECAWLKSGSYRGIDPFDDDSALIGSVQIDAVAKTGIDPEGQPFTMTSDGGCQFSINESNFTTRLIASSSGVVVVHGEATPTPIPADRNFALVLPEQTLPVSEFAGTWNAVSWDPTDAAATSFVATVHLITFDATGQVTALSDCVGLAACTPQSAPFSRFVVNANGGFDEILPNGTTFTRAFLYKTLAGRTVAAFITPERQFIVATRQGPITLPAVGAVSNFREFNLNGNRTIGALAENTVTVTAVDTSAKTVTRLRSADNRVDTSRYDQPRDGLRYRALNSCTINGAASNCAELVQLPLQGMGITVSTSVSSNPATSFFGFAINKPAP